MSISTHTVQRIDPRNDARRKESILSWLNRHEWHRDALMTLAEATVSSPSLAPRRNGFASLQVACEHSHRGVKISAADMLLAALNDRLSPERIDSLWLQRITPIVAGLENDLERLSSFKMQRLPRTTPERTHEHNLARAVRVTTAIIEDFRQVPR